MYSLLRAACIGPVEGCGQGGSLRLPLQLAILSQRPLVSICMMRRTVAFQDYGSFPEYGDPNIDLKIL